jgi:hypothetical protein
LSPIRVSRKGRSAASPARQLGEGKTRWQVSVTTVRAARQPGRGEARRARRGLVSGSPPNGAARKRAETRRRLLLAGAAVIAVVGVVGALVAVKFTATPARPVASESQASSVVVRQVTSVPAAVLAEVSPGQAVTPLQTVRTSGPPLTITGKPVIVFVSEESCPFCAAERWSVAVALSHFGTWDHLGSTTSSATDVYPDTATLSFRTAVYQSTELTLRTTELADNAGRPLQAQTPLDTRLIDAFDVPPMSTTPTSPGRSRSSTSPIGTSWRVRSTIRGTRRPVGGPDRQPAQQPVEPGGTGNRRVGPGNHRGHRPGPAHQDGPPPALGALSWRGCTLKVFCAGCRHLTCKRSSLFAAHPSRDASPAAGGADNCSAEGRPGTADTTGNDHHSSPPINNAPGVSPGGAMMMRAMIALVTRRPAATAH